jgi:multicomponent Na+:H+ antiporter subunit D
VTSVVGLVAVLPLLAAAVVLGLRSRATVRDVVTLAVLAATTGLSAALLVAVDRDGTVVLRVGGWAPELGIVLVADLFAALILLVSTATILVVELFAIGQRRTPAGPTPRSSRRCCWCSPAASVWPSSPVISSPCSSRSS